MEVASDQTDEENQSVKSNCFTRIKCGLDYVFCYQWRKKLLWILFFIIILLISLNFTLTIWLFTVLQISPNHIGQIKILKSGFEFSGKVLIMDSLKASLIYAEPQQDLVVESAKSFKFETKENDSVIENRLYLGDHVLELISNNVSFVDVDNRTIFEISDEEVYLNTTHLEINNDGGVVVNESIEFSNLTTPFGSSLVFESPTKSIEMRTDESVMISANAGYFHNICLKDMKLDAEQSIHLLAPEIMIPDMQISAREEETTNIFSTDYNLFVRTYQMCMCENGKVFLTMPQNACTLTDASKVCGDF